MTADERHLANCVDQLAAAHGVDIVWERMAKTAVVHFDRVISDVLAATADDLGLPYLRRVLQPRGLRQWHRRVGQRCPVARGPGMTKPVVS